MPRYIDTERKKNQSYYVSVSCSWIEEVKADSEEDAIKKVSQKYKYGNGRFPREYTEVDVEHCSFQQIED